MQRSTPTLWYVLMLFGFACASSSLRSGFNGIKDVEKTFNCIQNHPAFRVELAQCYQEKFKDITAASQPDLASMINVMCSLEDPTDCISNLLTKKSDCFSDKQSKVLQDSLKTFTAGYKYVCDNDGERIREFVDNDGQRCFETGGASKFSECAERDLAGAEQELEEVKGDEEKEEEIGCNFILKAKDCLINSLECKNERPIEFIEGLIHAMLKESPCWKHVAGRSEVVHASCYFSVIMSVVLLTIAN